MIIRTTSGHTFGITSAMLDAIATCQRDPNGQRLGTAWVELDRYGNNAIRVGAGHPGSWLCPIYEVTAGNWTRTN